MLLLLLLFPAIAAAQTIQGRTDSRYSNVSVFCYTNSNVLNESALSGDLERCEPHGVRCELVGAILIANHSTVRCTHVTSDFEVNSGVQSDRNRRSAVSEHVHVAVVRQNDAVFPEDERCSGVKILCPVFRIEDENAFFRTRAAERARDHLQDSLLSAVLASQASETAVSVENQTNEQSVNRYWFATQRAIKRLLLSLCVFLLVVLLLSLSLCAWLRCRRSKVAHIARNERVTREISVPKSITAATAIEIVDSTSSSSKCGEIA